jgi:hypothetical protein
MPKLALKPSASRSSRFASRDWVRSVLGQVAARGCRGDRRATRDELARGDENALQQIGIFFGRFRSTADSGLCARGS